MKVFRGTSLRSFQSYGIHTLEELISLKGQYIFEEGFTSTSFNRDKSKYGKELEYFGKYNVEIICLIPKETNEVMPLITSELSYSSNESELLIDSYSLFKVLDVQINIDDNTAVLKVALIPKKIYDPYYQNKEQELGSKSK